MNVAAHWHTDFSFNAEPATNYQDLPEDIRNLADGLICAHADAPTKGLIQL